MGVKILKKANSAKVKKPLTLRQQKVVALVGSGGKTKAEILREVGYSPAVVDNPAKVFDSPGIKEAIDPVIARMQRIREKALIALEEKPMERESAFNLTLVSNIMTKDVELLSGRPTSREEHVLDPEEQKKFDELLAMNKKGTA